MGLEALRERAAARHQLVLVRELDDFGLSRRQVEGLRKDGWLTEVRRGVLLVGGGEPTEWQRVVAASMVSRPSGAISHSTAARIHRFAGVAPTPVRDGIELTIPVGDRQRLSDCTVHRVVRLPEEDVGIHRGVRVTKPTRTLIDIAPRLTASVLEKTVDEGLIARLWDERSLSRAVAHAGGRAGIATLRRLMAYRDDPSAVDSTLEQRVARALRSMGPFETGYQVVLEGRVFILDLAWPAYKVGAECDGWTTRSRSRSKFDRDRRKVNILASHGWTVIHLTSVMSDDEMRAAVFRVLLRAATGRAAVGR